MGTALLTPQLDNVYTHYREGFKALEQAAAVAETLCDVAVELGASPTGLNSTNALKAVLKAARRSASLDAKAEDLGYTSVEVALKALGQRRPSRLPALYDVAPPHWVQPARLQRVRDGLKERTYKVPAVTPKQAQALLRGVRPLLEQLYELWDEDDGFHHVETAYKDLNYEDFVREVHLALFEEVTGETSQQLVEDEPTAPPTEEAGLLTALNSLALPTDYGVGALR
ncbi:hypothetical protein CB0101_11440 [Synechococcus sp. CB0101]|uniref:hypothetical protein n=1 Tax=Synechococcus sp. CB0101 TaxID=232348 RepID=UPI0002002258|nr:hypothetical protein [Synechococcus sp. CB0101]QCH15454.1 hypothetical protein CB0101_11440 [Synechococcus sp. CB0101]